jgi:hypothetical protein
MLARLGRRWRWILGALVIAASLLGIAGAVAHATWDHQAVRDGVHHREGLGDPAANCSGCHGATLGGGEEAPSCLSCHRAVWGRDGG